ncbi:hypothetical protein [Knoellia subterranea]|uniref:hypothetical protein n=1 Tax=Knoellia subterranea TaxID=184882 RepID=UPI001FE136A6|nr:hypothetical protein [Knoellia subterranea]
MKRLWGRRWVRLVSVPVVLGLLAVLLPWAWILIASVGRVHDASDVADAPEAPVALVLGAGLQGGQPSP